MNIRVRCVLLLMVTASALVSADDTIHIIRRGETVYSIARTYGISPNEVIRMNGLTDPSKIQVGQRIKIPHARGSGGAGASAEYRVSRGDTFSSIARLYGVTLGALLQANGFSENHVLKAGERIKIPLPLALSPSAAGPPPVNYGDVVLQTSGTAAKGDLSIRWPVAAKEVSYMTGKLNGVVLVGEQSEAVKSLTEGTVVSAGPYRGFGKVVIVQMPGGYFYVYGGCESLSVKEGDRVAPGSELGRLGIDGVSSKPQLFFLVYLSNSPIDPAKAPRT